ncbi:hypothetical protein S7711_11230 [Stachybotrys chartarum IBT 7711]|uniref:Uncharacterized protein n=1 Tax=Stachybotrys chartarum (strain CBS 109288 / IBT 7711) TaxID=1280523 RepID=A0A084AJS5_STACB|nr:hypothetical protein S7711_11230 [Stachybotrys chartarum IBT 7711]KFA51754.1 hypothetical protein S40293_10649 [Stachybotrys chartarum IBT 40293]KFA72771.1 hypothetical protein S40288_11117 [Stachybotrys chartarum IBT 40288]
MPTNTASGDMSSNSKPVDLETASIASHSSNTPLLKNVKNQKDKASDQTWTQEKLMAQALKSQVRISM